MKKVFGQLMLCEMHPSGVDFTIGHAVDHWIFYHAVWPIIEADKGADLSAMFHQRFGGVVHDPRAATKPTKSDRAMRLNCHDFIGKLCADHLEITFRAPRETSQRSGYVEGAFFAKSGNDRINF